MHDQVLPHNRPVAEDPSASHRQSPRPVRLGKLLRATTIFLRPAGVQSPWPLRLGTLFGAIADPPPLDDVTAEQLALIIKLQARFRSLIYSRAMANYCDQSAAGLRKFLDAVLVWGVLVNLWIFYTIIVAVAKNGHDARGPPAFLLQPEGFTPEQHESFGQTCDWGGDEYRQTKLTTPFQSFPVFLGGRIFLATTVAHMAVAHILLPLGLCSAANLYWRTFHRRSLVIRSIHMDRFMVWHNLFLVLQVLHRLSEKPNPH